MAQELPVSVPRPTREIAASSSILVSSIDKTSSLALIGIHMKIDDCASQPCLNQGVCTQGPFTYDCRCARPYTGKRCDSVSSVNCKCNTTPLSPGTFETCSAMRLESMFQFWTMQCGRFGFSMFLPSRLHRNSV